MFHPFQPRPANNRAPPETVTLGHVADDDTDEVPVVSEVSEAVARFLRDAAEELDEAGAEAVGRFLRNTAETVDESDLSYNRLLAADEMASDADGSERVRVGGEDGKGEGEWKVAVFLNSKSGGQKGAKLAKGFKKAGIMVCNLSEKKPEEWMNDMPDRSRLRILVAGGDGTVRWVVEAMEKVNWAEGEEKCPVGVLPLGTGNDFSRVTGWGVGYTGQAKNDRKIDALMARVLTSDIKKMDRWEVNISATDAEDAEDASPRSETLVNYFSIGVDARIANSFHHAREKHPGCFKSRLTNQAIYAALGGYFLFVRRPKLHNIFTLKVDGQVVKVPSSCMSIVVLNIDSFAAGCRLWGKPPPKTGFKPVDMNDGMVEVLAVWGAAELGIKKLTKQNASRIAQGHNVEIIPIDGVTKKVDYQVDGEPWRQTPQAVSISIKDHINVLEPEPVSNCC